MARLRTAVVMDYQNMHMSGYELYRRELPRKRLHENLLDPSRFANELLATRNRAQLPGRDQAVLSRVEVYRGLASSIRDSGRNTLTLRQQHAWQRDPRVTVRLRPLKYARARATDPGPRRIEKGIDVSCALALLRLARDPEIDLVILASHDSDLKPALDDAIDMRTAKIETCAWVSPRSGPSFRRLAPTAPRRAWHTRLQLAEFLNAFDPTDYENLRPA